MKMIMPWYQTLLLGVNLPKTKIKMPLGLREILKREWQCILSLPSAVKWAFAAVALLHFVLAAVWLFYRSIYGKW